ncbi:Repeat domain-containing protein [Chryseolinea serpens]|uniref:Repeat domain-containing protein n=1 Tax=Chryseolinea serpens TaxID=947013 RepID=A0A1M5VNC8_9BACT|nr:VCBS repeat-containing protein [Chryseolinea serpens]SHH76749.1 Repeat domain-containing protein [Chryseolinea serpens]
MKLAFLNACAGIVFTFSACVSPQEKPLFVQRSSEETGLTFNNLIVETDSLNVLSFEYIYNGGGVGVGDVNNDGLQDLFFTGNLVSSKLYLNQGNLKFKDVTLPAGLATTAWCTGVAMVDINQDGLLDIYISTTHPKSSQLPPNLLYVNRGIGPEGVPRFEEVAARVGLGDPNYTVQSAFLDYDLDGDLDVYLLTNFVENYNRNTPYGQHHDGRGNSVDKLFRNEGITDGLPVFKEVSREAGILSEGWGLGVLVNDINKDGYPDIYVANDFIANDHLYINNRNGTFTNAIGTYFKHQEHDGMGVDIADINNDGLNDVMVVDMMPEDNLRQKAMFSNIGYDRFNTNLQRGYQTQYVRNVLQLNNGNGTFSDIGYLAGVYATDWSWSSLLADVDNDGYRDLFITNGFRKDITDLDFVTYSKEAKMFGTTEIKLRKTLEAVNALEGVRKPNYLFRNNGNLTFTNLAPVWGMKAPSYSTGAAYADLDNDGDLDLVMNNINDKAFLYENTLETWEKGRHYLRVKLNGNAGNPAGLGAKLSLHASGLSLYAEHEGQRGYQSTVDPVEHFGLGEIQTIEWVKVVWPGGKNEVIRNISADQTITLKEVNAKMPGDQTPEEPKTKTTFTECHAAYNLLFRHEETDFVDYKQGQPLLLHKHSQDGPALAVGDLNGDGLEDVILGGAARQHATIFVQQKKGGFLADSLITKVEEDMGILLVDVDHDHDLDLYCVSGSSEHGLRTKLYQDRLYRNNGKGNFTLDPTALPETTSSGSCVTACDFDKDGDLDLFVGGRIMPTQYPQIPQSYILQNDGKGNFKDVTEQLCLPLQRAGMVTAALWTDYNNDGWIDLALVGEWMPVSFYKNNQGKGFTKIFAAHKGWWNSITGGDVDNDGDTDYVLGNLGRNALFQASDEEPVSLYAKDFDGNGSMDPIVTRYIQGKEYPTHYRESMTEQMVGLRRKLTRYATYGKMTFNDLMSRENLDDAMIFHGTWLASAYLENTGDGTFKIEALPVEAQWSPMLGVALTDVNGDGNLDMLGIGNCYSSETLTGFYDAGIGVCLYGNGAGDFKSSPPQTSGFFVDKDAKALSVLHHGSGKVFWIAANNRDSLRVFEQTPPASTTLLRPEPDDAYAEIIFSNGEKQRHEFYFGDGYLSQSSRSFYLPDKSVEVVMVKVNGSKRRIITQK